MEPLAGISHVDLLKVIITIAALLGTARLLGELCTRAGIPAVVGEILAGVLLGPSLLSRLPTVAQWIIPSTPIQAQLLELIGMLGVMFLLIVIGMETDLGMIRTRFRTSIGVGIGGWLVPFVTGIAVGYLIPDDLLPDPGQRGIFSLFLAVVLSLSAIPVLAKILTDLGLMRRPFGQTVLAAGMIDDLLGWTLLGIVTSLAAAGTLDLASVARTLGAVALFGVATLIVARPVTRGSLRFVQDHMQTRDRLLTLLVTLAFAWGAFTQALHLEPILGAFAIGILFGQTRRMPLEVGRQLESVTYGVFAPIFLAAAGLRLDIGLLLQPRLLLLTLALLVTAALGKVAGAYAGARMSATGSRRESLAFGIALNARGVLGIIVAAIGLSMAILSVEIYSMLVVVSVVTSLLAPIGLKLILGRESDEERAASENLNTARRVLLPVRVRPIGDSDVQVLEAAALGRLARDGLAVTLFSGVERGGRREASLYQDELGRLFPPGTEISKRIVPEGDMAQLIGLETERGYDLVAMGAPEGGGGPDHVFSSMIDDVVRLAPCPTLVFRAGSGQWPPRRILVPTGGSPWARRAAELAFSLADEESDVLIFHVVDSSAGTRMSTGAASAPAARMGIGQEIVEDLRKVGETIGVEVVSEVRMGGEMTESVLERAGAGDVDLMILGTAVRAGSQRLYLGPKVQRLLESPPCPVIVLNA